MNALQRKFQSFRSSLSSSLVEREAEVELTLIGLIAKEHVLLVGPPGVGKSQLLDGVANWLDTTSFHYLLTKFTDPMELFGPIDLDKLKQGMNWRRIDGYMPKANFIFADEIFKASSAILNTLLKILNERTFKYGLQEHKVPLQLAVAASNEWPNTETMQELGALFDRFLLRKKVRPVSSKGRQALINRAFDNDDFRPVLSENITEHEIQHAFKEMLELPASEEALEALTEILDQLHSNNIEPGDRRIVKSTKVVRAKAWLEGHTEVQKEDLQILSHVFWTDPMEQPEKAEEIITKIADPTGAVLYDSQQEMFDVENRAKEKLKTVTSVIDRNRVIEEVIRKAREIETELETRKDVPLKLKILTYVKESRKNWDRKLNNVPGK